MVHLHVIYSMDTIQYFIIAFLFVWSLLNIVYYYVYSESRNGCYAVAFVLVAAFQIIFYALAFAEAAGHYERPYPDYFTELSYKRNLVFAILAVIVTSDNAHRLRKERKYIADNIEET